MSGVLNGQHVRYTSRTSSHIRDSQNVRYTGVCCVGTDCILGFLEFAQKNFVNMALVPDELRERDRESERER